jgi:hypothetical protein
MPKKKATRKAAAKKPENYMEERFKEFGEDIEEMTQSIGRHDKRHHEFDAMSPVIKSVVGMIFLVFLIWILKFANVQVPNVFLYGLGNFLYNNLGLLFIASLLFNYGDYLSSKYKAYCLVSPLVNGFRGVFMLWILTYLFIFVGDYSNVSMLSGAAAFVYAKLYGIFIIFVLLGYVFEFVCCMKKKCCCMK